VRRGRATGSSAAPNDDQAGRRVEFQLALHQRRQAIVAFPEVDRRRGDHHAHRLRRDDHRTERSAAARVADAGVSPTAFGCLPKG